MKFKEFNLSKELLEDIETLGFEEPTGIQEKAIPPILKGKDVIGESATGSGKTLAFGCGIVDRISPKAGLQALVITPTRELALQVKKNLQSIGIKKKMQMTTIYGGVSLDPQTHELQTADVAIATPGRLLDHIERKNIDLSAIKIIVLDEADRMLDMGFIEDIERIMSCCPDGTQKMFFSATLPRKIKDLANSYMNNPVTVAAEQHVDPGKLNQVYYDVPRNLKLSLLIHLLKNESSKLVIVFCNTRDNTDFVTKNLRANKVDATSLHGGLTQSKRTRTVELFEQGKVDVLVCTDVAARGLHISNVSHVYNYDIPKDPTEYVHRIGRTARAGEEGEVINLLTDYDYENFARVKQQNDFNIVSIEKPHIERIFAKRDEASRNSRSSGPRNSFGNSNRPYRGKQGSSYKPRNVGGNRSSSSNSYKVDNDAAFNTGSS